MSGSAIIPWVVGNWKMNPMQSEQQQLIQNLKQLLQDAAIAPTQCRMAVAPTTLALMGVKQQLQDAAVSIETVAQDVSRKAATGAYTGEVSAELLKDAGLGFVLIGHSERREFFADTVDVLQEKIKNALQAGLKIIYCVGESLEQREAGQAEVVVLQQICDLSRVVQDEQWSEIMVAYEPIWAIGTGKTASPEDAQAMHAQIRQGLKQMTSQGEHIALLYGGSVKADNAVALAACPDINGALVGGASLDATSFYQIAQAFAQSAN